MRRRFIQSLLDYNMDVNFITWNKDSINSIHHIVATPEYVPSYKPKYGFLLISGGKDGVPIMNFFKYLIMFHQKAVVKG